MKPRSAAVCHKEKPKANAFACKRMGSLRDFTVAGFSLIMFPPKMAQRLVGHWATDEPHANPAAAAFLFISHKH